MTTDRLDATDRRTYDDLAQQLAALPYEARELAVALAHVAYWHGLLVNGAWLLPGFPDPLESDDSILTALADRLDELVERPNDAEEFAIAWSDYRAEYGATGRHYAAFRAGWEAARGTLELGGPQR